MAILLKNATILNPAASVEIAGDVFISDAGLFSPAPPSVPMGTRILDASDCLVTPGLLDIHVHFRDPGHTVAETLQSGAEAAVAGGFTRVVTMPNTVPSGDSCAWILRQREASVPVEILPAPCITKGRQGKELADLEALAPMAAAFTDDGAMVADPSVMRSALVLAAKLGKTVMDHAVLPAIAGKGVVRDCAAARKFGLPVFPADAEIAAVAQDIALARETGAHVHIQHLSCAGSVELIRAARKEGVTVTAEVSPHHLAFSAEDIPGDDGNYRMNPPLGNPDDVRELRKAVLDGTLSAFATDHAPHTPETKEFGFAKAAFGVIGLETAASVTWDIMVVEEGLSPERWVELWTSGPASVLGVASPVLAYGAPADLAVFRKASWVYSARDGKSKSRNSPFDGQRMGLCPVMTFCRGANVYDRF